METHEKSKPTLQLHYDIQHLAVLDHATTRWFIII